MDKYDSLASSYFGKYGITTKENLHLVWERIVLEFRVNIGHGYRNGNDALKCINVASLSRRRRVLQNIFLAIVCCLLISRLLYCFVIQISRERMKTGDQMSSLFFESSDAAVDPPV